MLTHGINVQQQKTSVITPAVATSGIPYVIGTAPLQAATASKGSLVPVLCTSWDEAVNALGYSDDWKKYTLCEVMYSHFKLFGCQPVIFCPMTDAAEGTKVEGKDVNVADHKITLPFEAIADDRLKVSKTGEQGEYVKDEDYSVYYDEDKLVIELLSDGAAYDSDSVYVEYYEIDTEEQSVASVGKALEAVDTCLTRFGVVPDLLIAPGYSQNSEVAALMATKADGIDGMFKAKAIVDLEADTYTTAVQAKNANNIIDVNQIPCYGTLSLGEKSFHLSTQVAGLMAKVDSENGGCPYESPSNKNVQCDGVHDSLGKEMALSVTQANLLNENGIVTVLNFFNGYVMWGNYNACYPGNTDVKDMFIATSRMFNWVGNTLIKTFWQNVDDPMNKRLIDTVLDTVNIWLNGLVGRGYLLGARAEFLESENPVTDLMCGKIRIHVYITPPTPAQRIDFVTEYDTSYVSALFAS